MANVTRALSGVSATGSVGSLGTDSIALTLPRLRLSIAGVGAVPGIQGTLPMPVLSITGSPGMVGSVTLTLPRLRLAIASPNAVNLMLPRLQLAVSGTTGNVGAVVLKLPAPKLTIRGLDSVSLTLPAPALQITGSPGAIGSVQFNLRPPLIAIAGDTPVTGQVALALPTLQLAISGTVGNVGAVSMTLRRLALAIEGFTGTVGKVALTLPIVVLRADGYEQSVGTVQLVLPQLQLVATGSQAAITPDSTQSNTIAMHTETMGLTSYSNFPFNSFAAFNGVYLAASPDGVFTLGGNTDNGALIQAATRVGITDFGTSHLKRIDRIYVGYRTDGNLVLRVFTEEINQRDYLLTATGRLGLHGNHARLGKGLEARYWQFEVRNQGGADFQLNAIELKPTVLKRRVGGGNA